MQQLNIKENQPKMAATYAAEILDISIQAIHKKLKQNNIVLPKNGNKAYLTHDHAKYLFNNSFSKKNIAFQIVKGGVGKTTSTLNICCCASLYGAKVLVIDLDPQANLTDSFNIDAERYPVLIDIISGISLINDSIVPCFPGIDLLPSRIENVVLDNKLALEAKPLHTLFKNILSPIEGKYDYIFIDCPATLGHSVTAAALYTKFVLTPLNPDKYSAKGLKILKNEIENIKNNFKEKIDYTVFLNKFSSNTILSDKAISTVIAEEMLHGKALNTAIRNTQEIPNSADDGHNLFSYLKKSTAKYDFDLLTRELLNINF